MKKLLLASAAILGLAATTAVADDFDNTALKTVVYTSGYELSLSGDVNNGLDDFAVGRSFLEHDFGAVGGNLHAELSYGIVSENVGLDLEYQAYTAIGAFGVYGALSAEYLAASDDIGGGDWDFAPYVGASYDFTDRVGTYTEVGYSWDMSNDWDQNGGYAEIGLDFAVTDNVAITPSITRTFDTANDEYQAGLTVGFSF